MTQNQLAYQSMRENQRANLAREAETHRANLAQEQISTTRNVETQRSNLAHESILHKDIDRKAFEYKDMAGYNKAVAVATTAERGTKSVSNIIDSVSKLFIPKKK